VESAEMARLVVVHRFDLISVHEEAKKMKRCFEDLGWETDLIHYPNFALVPSDFEAYDRAIFWTAYTHFEAGSFRRFWNFRFAHRIVSYYVIEGIAKGMTTEKPLLNQQYIVTPSRFAKECIELTGVTVNEVIPHQIEEPLIVDHSFGIAWRARHPRNKRLFTYIGNPIRRKGLIQLREAVEILAQKRNDFHVVIHTANQPALQGYKIEELRHPNITVELEFAKISKAQALAKMRYSDFYVHPAHSEGFGLEVLEALQMRKPLVCIDAPAVNEIATPKNSFMTPHYEFVVESYYPGIDFRVVNYRPGDLASQMELALTSSKEKLDNKIAEGVATTRNFRDTYKRFLVI
jgi:glycosyltransferase involved in cell wall biosynthesis